MTSISKKAKKLLRFGKKRAKKLDPAWIALRPFQAGVATPEIEPKGTPGLPDAQMERLLAAYRRSAPDQYYGADSMWTEFFAKRHQPLHKVFFGGSVAEARDILHNPIASDLFYGFDCLNPIGAASTAPAAGQAGLNGYAWNCYERLRAACEAMGIVRLENPESPSWNMEQPPADELIDKLNAAFNATIDFPTPYPRELGLKTRRGIASYRAIHALYTALQARMLLKGRENPAVLEIGAGVGRTAYFANRLGITDYTIVDLPFTAISQGYYLMQTLGGEKVSLSGEAQPDSTVKVLTPDEFLGTTKHYDLIINIDSFTEIDSDVADGYWKKMEQCADRFWSVNHEVNPRTVRDYINKSPRAKAIFRYPAWLRRGYVEELVEFLPE